MNILILTSKDHIYANLFLRMAFDKGLFEKDSVTIWEQDAIIPGKTKIAGLLKYLKISGFYYVFAQILKHYLFQVRQLFDSITLKHKSVFYPYWKTAGFQGTRETFNGIKTVEAHTRVKILDPDLIISVFSKEIIPDRILKIPKWGAVNIHPSFLPMYRGVSPVFWSLANDEKYAGVTLHYLTSEIDAGDIIARKRIAITAHQTEHSLYLNLTIAGFKLFEKYIEETQKNKREIITTIQPQETPSYYSLPTKKAMKKLLSNGYKLFTLQEMLIKTYFFKYLNTQYS